LDARGVSEIGMTGVGAGLVNAVYNATGKHVRELPTTFDNVLSAW
jgi:xanthine dehydrogenase YagR molybdenum-binding subunit